MAHAAEASQATVPVLRKACRTVRDAAAPIQGGRPRSPHDRAHQGPVSRVVRRPYHFRITIHAGPDQVSVLFDGERAAVKTRRVAIEQASAPTS